MLLAIAALVLLPAALLAQATLGSAAVSGQVRDSSDAVLPGARVVLTEPARGLDRDTLTNEAGNFLFPSVPAGLYSLRVTKENFDAYQLTDLLVEVGQRATVNVQLRVGQVSTVVSVAASVETVLETESNALGTVVDSSRVESLPLNGRNFLSLAYMAGAVVESTGRSNVVSGQTGHPERTIIIAGNLGTTTGYLINGIATRGGRLGESALNLSVAGIDQFKVQQSFFMPDQGPNPGLVNVTTKGGGNQFHGQVFEFVRNKILDARNFFSPDPENLHRNQFGGAIGGPIRKDKLWFYANYEGLREITAFSSRAYTPTKAMFGGDFGEVPEQIYDPLTFSAQAGRRQPFANNIIPAGRVNAVSKNLLPFYLPGSSLSQRPSNLFANPRNRLDDDQYGVRLDAALTNRQNIYAQFINQDSPVLRPGIFPLSGASFPSDTQLAMAQHTYTLRPNLVNTLRAGLARNVALFANEGRDAGHILGGIGIQNTKDDRGVTGIGFQEYAGFGRANGDLGNLDNNYQLDEGVNYIRGAHQLQFGLGVRYRRTWQQNANAGAHGNLGFQQTFTAQLGPNAAGQLVPQARTGNAFADFLLGMPTTGSVAGLPMFPYRFTQYMPYFQDTWKATRNLTLNYGISWFKASIPEPQGSARDLPHGFDQRTGLLTLAVLGQVDPKILSPDSNNFTPRFGVAWRPSFLPNTVIRSGAGIYYSDTALIEMQFAMVAPPFNNPIQANNGQLAPLPAYELGRNIFPATPLPPLDRNFAASLPSGAAPFLLAEDGRSPYVTQWNFSVQHLVRESLVELEYIGASAHRIQNRYDFAQCRPSGDLRCDPASKPWPRYASLLRADFNGNASYHALVAKYDHRLRGGLNLRAAYTFSKALNDTWESSASTDSQITVCRRCDKGAASFDVRHRAVVSSILDVPYGRGRRFGRNAPRAADLVLGGWTLTGITIFATGVPFYLSEPNRTGSPFVTHRPNRICDGRDSDLSHNLRNNGFLQFQTSCFETSAAGFFGNAGRNILYGPGRNNWDVGIEKALPIREQARLEFRAEMFNAFNHTQFGQPNADTGAGGNFGRVSAAQAPRLIQLGLKLLW